MSEPLKPLPSPAPPQQLPRGAPVVASALAGFVATAYALNQGAGGSLETGMSWSRVAAVSTLYLVVAFAVVAVSVIRRQRARGHRANPMMLAYVVLVAFVALGYGTWEAFSVPMLIAPASSLPGASNKLIQFQ